jgi:hypothetical protein
MGENRVHELVIEYRASGEGKDRIYERVARLLYRDPRRFGFDDEDAAAEALIKHRERISRLVDRFEDRVLPFDAYLATCLRYIARTQRREKRNAAERARVCERSLVAGAAGAAGAEEIDSDGCGRPEPPLSGLAGRTPAAATAFGTRLVFLFVKCAWDADEDSATRVAEAAGVSREWLCSAGAQARRFLEAERARFERMSGRRNGSWCRLRFLETRLREELEQPRREKLSSALERERIRFERARSELRSFRPVVPNAVVARILGVPKGTVDSGLYYLKKRAGRIIGEEEEEGERTGIDGAVSLPGGRLPGIVAAWKST